MDLFDREGTFGDDYLYFYSQFLDDERNVADADRVVDVLGLRSGDRVLDAPCGHGRIANLLAARGMHVTGIDATHEFLSFAEASAADVGVDVDYRVGDLRELGVDGPFDAIVCWFTSFGYFDDEGNRAVLTEFARVLKPGGSVAIETIHHDGFVRGFIPSPFADTVQVGDDVMLSESRFDPATGRIVTDRVVHRDGDVRRSEHQVRLPTIPEFDQWLAEAGFSERAFLGREGGLPTIDDMRMVVRATR